MDDFSPDGLHIRDDHPGGRIVGLVQLSPNNRPKELKVVVFSLWQIQCLQQKRDNVSVVSIDTQHK